MIDTKKSHNKQNVLNISPVLGNAPSNYCSLKVVFPQNSYVDNPVSQMMLLGVGTFGRQSYKERSQRPLSTL